MSDRKETDREYRRLVRLAFPERNREIWKRYSVTPKARATNKRYRMGEAFKATRIREKQNPEAIANRNRLWRAFVKTPHGRVWRRLRNAARYARIREATIDKSARAVVVEIETLAFLCCTWCGRVLLKSERCIDHIIALTLGGPHTAENLTCSCAHCNSRKHARSLEDWMEEL